MTKYETAESVYSREDEAEDLRGFIRGNPNVWVKVPHGLTATWGLFTPNGDGGVGKSFTTVSPRFDRRPTFSRIEECVPVEEKVTSSGELWVKYNPEALEALSAYEGNVRERSS